MKSKTISRLSGVVSEGTRTAFVLLLEPNFVTERVVDFRPDLGAFGLALPCEQIERVEIKEDRKLQASAPALDARHPTPTAPLPSLSPLRFQQFGESALRSKITQWDE
jgi:hypothetical protein